MKRLARAVGAGVVSAGLVGIFAFPAYATPEQVAGEPDGAPAQHLVTADAEVALETPLPLAQRTVVQRAAVAAPTAKYNGRDLPSGVGASGLVNAALAQLGDYQDCTAMVERALRAIGFAAGDLGTRVSDYAQYGHEVKSGGYAPGDILVWPGRHVSIYIGNGQAVHGGWGGNQTVVARYSSPSASPAVVRIG